MWEPIVSPRSIPAQRGGTNFSVMQDRSGNLWLGNNDGLFLRRSGGTRFVRQTSSDKAVGIVLADQIWALQEDAKGASGPAACSPVPPIETAAGNWHGVPDFSGYSDGFHHPRCVTF